MAMHRATIPSCHLMVTAGSSQTPARLISQAYSARHGGIKKGTIPNASQNQTSPSHPLMLALPPNPGAAHNPLKLLPPHPDTHARAPVRLEDHIPQHGLVYLLLEHGSH